MNACCCYSMGKNLSNGYTLKICMIGLMSVVVQTLNNDIIKLLSTLPLPLCRRWVSWYNSRYDHHLNLRDHTPFSQCPITCLFPLPLPARPHNSRPLNLLSPTNCSPNLPPIQAFRLPLVQWGLSLLETMATRHSLTEVSVILSVLFWEFCDLLTSVCAVSALLPNPTEQKHSQKPKVSIYLPLCSYSV